MKNNKHLDSEFEEFLSLEMPAPQDVQLKIFKKINRLLNPTFESVFTKIFGVHVVFGFLSLGICSQFGLNPFGNYRTLSDWLMKVGGHSLCMIGCGMLFVGGSIFVSGYLLSKEDLKLLRRTEFVQSSLLAILSLIAFNFFGADTVLTLLLLWMVGAVIGGFAATKSLIYFQS